jgi:protein O-mannosyl-transferase
MLKINISKIKKSRLYVIIVLITFIIYGNSINNEYSLDDNIVVEGIEKVNKGLKGIPEIFTTHHAVDKKQSYDYRPTVLLTFAIEKQFFGKLPETQTLEEKKRRDKLTQANISHFINVLLYAFTGIVLFNFLLLLLKDYNKALPLLITLLFVVHPLHTEPVANIKSRDELLMFLGIMLALTNYLKFSFTSKYKYLLYAGLFVILAILSKKTALVLLGMLPVILYFSKVNLKKIVICMSSILCFVIVVIGMRKGLLTSTAIREVKFFENPLFLEGDFMDRIATGLYCSWFYLKMLIFPRDMSYYYGYNHIPMADFSFYQVWLALVLYIPLLVYGIWKLLKREVIGIGIALWIGVMFAYLNILAPVVGIVADRFTYVFSLGFCIVVGYLLFKIFKIDFNKDVHQLKLPNGFIITVLIIMVVYSGRVVARNPNWHDYLTTYYHDVEVVPNSAKAHSLISNTLYGFVNKNRSHPKTPEYVNEIIRHYKRALEIDSTYLTCYSNLGSAYIDMMQDNQSGIYYCSKAIELDADYLEANLNLAVAYDRSNKPDSAFKYYLRVVEINPDWRQTYTLLNNFLSKNGKVNQGILKLEEIASSANSPKNIFMNIANLYSLDETNINISLTYFEKAFEIDKNDKILCGHIANLYSRIGNQEKANFYTNLYNTLN